MDNIFSNYKKTKEYLVCVDSDGCAIDSMDIKHIRCFGPCMVEEWDLKQWEEAILTRWNDINLYTNSIIGSLSVLYKIGRVMYSNDSKLDSLAFAIWKKVKKILLNYTT